MSSDLSGGVQHLRVPACHHARQRSLDRSLRVPARGGPWQDLRPAAGATHRRECERGNAALLIRTPTACLDYPPPFPQAIASAVATSQRLSIEVVNYKRSGACFMNHLMLEPLANGQSITHYMATLCESKEEAPAPPTPALPFPDAGHHSREVSCRRNATRRRRTPRRPSEPSAQEPAAMPPRCLQRPQRLAPAGAAPPHRPPCAWPLGAREPGGLLARRPAHRRRELLVPGQGLRPAAARRTHGETRHPGHISRRCMPDSTMPCSPPPTPPHPHSPSRSPKLAHCRRKLDTTATSTRAVSTPVSCPSWGTRHRSSPTSTTRCTLATCTTLEPSGYSGEAQLLYRILRSIGSCSSLAVLE